MFLMFIYTKTPHIHKTILTIGSKIWMPGDEFVNKLAQAKKEVSFLMNMLSNHE